MNHRPNIKCNTIKLVEGNTGKSLYVISGLAMNFQIQHQKHNPRKTDKVDFTKNLCSAKDKKNEKTSHRVR